MAITAVKGRQIFDSRGKPTVEVDVTTVTGVFRASVPSGVSASQIGECLELRDGANEFRGKGVNGALASVNRFLGPELVASGLDVRNQQALDDLLVTSDGTDDKSRRGVNAIAPTSTALCRAGAAEKGIPLYQHIAGLMGIDELILPMPVFNMINGGIHTGNLLPFSEFCVLPKGAKSYSEAYKMGTDIYHTLKYRIQKKFGIDGVNVGDQGGFSPPLHSVEDAFRLLVGVIDDLGYNGKVSIAVDVAASEFYREGKYDLDFKNRKSRFRKVMNSIDLGRMYEKWIQEFPIAILEDPFSFDDWRGFTELTRKAVGVSILADDLTATNPHKIHTAARRGACNGFLIKLNQVGTVSEVMNACQCAHGHGWTIMVSHRSGDTEDPFIADLAVGVQARYIKAGAPCRTERTAKYNQLLRIEEELGVMAVYAGCQLSESTEL